MSDLGYHQARMMTSDDIQLIQLHCPVPAHLSAVLCHSSKAHTGQEFVFAPRELSALLAVETCLCTDLAWRDGRNLCSGAGCFESEKA